MGLEAYPLNYWLVTCRDVSSTPVMATSSHNMDELENVSKGDSDSQKIVVPESGLKITRV